MRRGAMAEDGSEKGVKSLNLALDVIEAVAAADDEVGVTELASRLGLLKATAFRHLQTLADRDYLSQNPKTSRYRLGSRFHVLASLSNNGLDLRSAADEPAQALRDLTGLSVVVSAVRARSVLVLMTAPAKSPIQIGVRPGSELSLHSSAQGRIALAFGRPSLLAAARREPLRPATIHTVTDWPTLEQVIEKTRAQGWADAPEELAIGLNAVAAPIFDSSDECVGTLALVGLLQSLPRDFDLSMTEPLLASAKAISRGLGQRT